MYQRSHGQESHLWHKVEERLHLLFPLEARHGRFGLFHPCLLAGRCLRRRCNLFMLDHVFGEKLLHLAAVIVYRQAEYLSLAMVRQIPYLGKASSEGCELVLVRPLQVHEEVASGAE